MASKEDMLVHSLSPRNIERKDPIGSEFFLPNVSGDHSRARVLTTPTTDTEIANKKYVDDAAGGVEIILVIKTADQTVNNSATLINDSELKFTANANKTYGGYMVIFLNGSTIADIKTALSVPTSATARRQVGDIDTALTATADFTAASSQTTLTSATVQMGFAFRVKVAGTSGTVDFSWAQNVSNVGGTTIEEGSYMIIWEETA